ncbi:MAG: non-ribosomal peptide synthetase, partial [Stackebrandtia sp.]
VRLVVCGGEPLDATVLGPWFDRYPHTSCRVVNMYGITETTVHVTSQTVTPLEAAIGSRSVGTALPGWSVSVRDEHGSPLPFGAKGEIYVGGAGVAAGYLNSADLTAARYIDDPFGAGTVYRSGDCGRLHPDGRLDHLGRLDDQVQLRGYRIELNEIRSVLLEDPVVTAAVVVVQLGPDGTSESARLSAYVVTAGDGAAADIRGRTARHLPDYMLPSSVTILPELPLTINGKVDVKALPRPADGPAGGGLGGPGEPGMSPAGAHDEVTTTMMQIWRDVLGTSVSVDSDFFELGGNSLLAVRMLAALRAAGIDGASIRELYLRPTIRGLALSVE